MISISRYLTDRGRENEAALRRTLGLLLHLIELHAIEGDAVDYTQFRSGIHAIADRFSEDTPAEDILIIIGEVATSLKDYAQRTTRFVKAQSSEYQRIVNMLTETIAVAAHSSDRTVERLREVERKLEKACVIEDIRMLRMQIEECLGAIRQEIQTQHAATSNSAARLLTRTRPTNAESPEPPLETDPVTGLPGRLLAESALQTACREGGAYWTAVIVADRLGAINSRFGYAVGDRILRRISGQLRHGLSAEDRIFRWSGPAFMALLLRTTPESNIRNEVARMTGGPIEEVVEIGSRSILLPVSSNWDLFPVNGPARAISERADQFVASRAESSPAN